MGAIIDGTARHGAVLAVKGFDQFAATDRPTNFRGRTGSDPAGELSVDYAPLATSIPLDFHHADAMAGNLLSDFVGRPLPGNQGCPSCMENALIDVLMIHAEDAMPVGVILHGEVMDPVMVGTDLLFLLFTGVAFDRVE